MQKFNSNFSEIFFNTSSPASKYDSILDYAKSVDKLTLSPFVGSIFTRYGNRPPYPFTVFDNCVQQNEHLPFSVIDNQLISSSSLSDYECFSIDKYLETLRKAVQTDRKNKVIFLSSGWDSTSILALLVDMYGPQDIICLTLRMSYDQNNPQNIAIHTS